METSRMTMLRIAIGSLLLLSFLTVAEGLYAQEATSPEDAEQEGLPDGDRDDDRVVVRERSVVVGPHGNVVRWQSKNGDVLLLDPAVAGRRMVIDALGGRGYLGVQVTELTPELRRHFGVTQDAGVMIARVFEDSPAERAGVLVGDILTEAGGEEIATSFDLSRRVRRLEEGERLGLRLWRDGAAVEVEAEVAELHRRTMSISADGEGPGLLFKIAGVPEIEKLDQEVFDIELPEGLDGVIGLHLREALGRAGAYFDSEEWKAKARRFEELDWEGIERRMKELEERLRELEADLKSEGQGQNDL